MSNKKIIITNILSSIIQQIVTLFNIFIPVLLIKKYGSDVNGLVISINQFLSYITLLELGIGPIIKSTLYKPLAKKNNEEIQNILGATNKFFKTISYIFIIYIIVLLLIYPNFVSNFNNLYVITLILIISISKFFEYFIGMTYKIFLQANQKNYIVDSIITITYIINIIFTIILLKLNCSIHLINLASSLIYVIRPIFLKLYFDKKYQIKIIKNKNYKLPQQWDGLFHHIASVVQSNTDTIILTIFSTLKNISVYSIYSLITNSIRTIIVALTNGIDAFFGKEFIEENNKIIKIKFDLYNFIFYTITTILLSCTLVLIIPFVNIYTKGITDANYINELFAYILVLGEFIYLIRYPYATIVYAKGHFKETRNFSLIEPLVNIILSTILVIKYGLIGVAIGTLISMFIRTFGFIIYATHNIFKETIYKELKIIILSILEITLITIIHIYTGNNLTDNYFDWVIYAINLFILISTSITLINLVFFPKIRKELKSLIKSR